MYNFQSRREDEKGKRNTRMRHVHTNKTGKNSLPAYSHERKYNHCSPGKRKLITDVTHIKGDRRRDCKDIRRYKILGYKKELRGQSVKSRGKSIQAEYKSTKE